MVEPLARFGSSAFGPIEARAISADGVTGDWLPLGTLVRLPGFKELRCPRAVSKPCTLTGSNLFLATSFAATPEFDNATEVPPDFTGTQLSVPHPANGLLYLKLRDDPVPVQSLVLPVMPALLGAQPTPQLPAQETQPAATPAPQAAQNSAPQTQPEAPPTAKATGVEPQSTEPPTAQVP
jgi:hypothetical protein